MIFAIYDKSTGIIIRSVDIPEFLQHMISVGENEALIAIPRMADDTTEYIKDGVLTLKPIADEPLEYNYSTNWV